MRQKGYAHIVLLLAILAIIGAVGFIVYPSLQTAGIYSPIPSLETMIEKDKMSGWESFSDSGYTFQYPSNWILKPSNSTNPASRTHALVNISDSTRREHQDTNDGLLDLENLGEDWVQMDINIQDMVFPYNYVSRVNNVDIIVDNYVEYLNKVAGSPPLSQDFIIGKLATYHKSPLAFVDNFTLNSKSEGASWYQAFDNNKHIQIKITYASLSSEPFVETEVGKIVSQILSTFELAE